MAESPPDKILAEPAVGDWNVLLVYRGSIAHGTYTPSDDPDAIDDKDLIGVAVPPVSYYLGLREFDEHDPGGEETMGRRGTAEVVIDEWDVVVYEARKALHLLRKGNPNVLAMLWVPPEMIVSMKPAGRLLLEHRDLFAVRSVYNTFVGYARDQRAKMITPGAYLGYMGKRRRQLVDRFGYDTKMASHLVRILRQGAEFLRTGRLQVQRPDAAELLAIKQGNWSKEQVLGEAERLSLALVEAYETSPLPPEIDANRIDQLATEIVQTGWQ